MEERTRLQKILLAVLAVMAAAFALLTLFSRAHPGAAFEGTLLRASAREDQTVYTGSFRWEDVTITVTPQDAGTTEVNVDIGSRFQAVYTVEYPLAPVQTKDGTWVDGIRVRQDGALVFAGGYEKTGDETRLYGQDGSRESLASSYAYATNVFWEYYEFPVPTAIILALGPAPAARGSWLLYFVVLFWSGLLALDIAFPMTLFYLRHACDVRDPEPTDFYIFTTKIGWFLGILVLVWYYCKALWTVVP